MHRTTIRLLLVLNTWVLVAALGTTYLRTVETPAEASVDDPSMLLQAAAAPTISRTANYREITVPTTAAAKATAPQRVRVRTAGPVSPSTRKVEPIVEIGTIEIPKIGLGHRIFEGITLRSIDQGPSHWPGTALPGNNGNAVFAGHRVTHSHPFRNLDKLVAGDLVIFTIQGRRSVYSVTSSEVVGPKEMRIVEQTPDPTATLFACHPPGSAKYRIVVHLRLAG